ncbi:MAG: nitroreductase family protein [Rickettsiales bacterium]|jgi:nitroreductase|nr:nitroreductase family protein [Rickettsiales bacterium]
MKKKSLAIGIASAAALGAVVLSFSRPGKQPAEALPEVEIARIPVLQTIDARQSHRSFSTRELDKKTLSEILWAAFGKNTHGTRTIPTANNKQALGVYAITNTGAYSYDGEENRLVLRTKQDLRPLFAQQDFVSTAPLTILFTGTDAVSSPIHAGAAVQNLGLYTAASDGLGGVARAFYDKEAVAKALVLAEGEQPIISYTIGYKE